MGLAREPKFTYQLELQRFNDRKLKTLAMTERKQVQPELKRLTRQAVDVDFDGGTLTSDGGLVLLREVDRRLDLIRRIDEAIPDPRDPLYTIPSLLGMFVTTNLGLAPFAEYSALPTTQG